MKKTKIKFIIALIFLMLLIICKPAEIFAQSTGELTNPNSDFIINVTTANNKQLILTSKNKSVNISPGKYTITKITIKKNDGKGVLWYLQSKECSIPFEIKTNIKTTLKFGEPLDIAIKGSNNTFNYEIIGNMGELYGSTVYKGGSAITPPNVRVVGPTGATLESGAFKAG